jgi:hypothetical protein
LAVATTVGPVGGGTQIARFWAWLSWAAGDAGCLPFLMCRRWPGGGRWRGERLREISGNLLGPPAPGRHFRALTKAIGAQIPMAHRPGPRSAGQSSPCWLPATARGAPP